MDMYSLCKSIRIAIDRLSLVVYSSVCIKHTSQDKIILRSDDMSMYLYKQKSIPLLETNRFCNRFVCYHTKLMIRKCAYHQTYVDILDKFIENLQTCHSFPLRQLKYGQFRFIRNQLNDSTYTIIRKVKRSVVDPKNRIGRAQNQPLQSLKLGPLIYH